VYTLNKSKNNQKKIRYMCYFNDIRKRRERKMYREYEKVVQKAIDYVETNLTEQIVIEELSKYVGYSPFHFHRIFQSITGMSIADYIKRRRMAVLAVWLTIGYYCTHTISCGMVSI
jgi:methylphosphotriester-DNA--protein-cysteine methyltransferase